MPRTGRPPKPVEQHRKAGTFRADRHGAAVDLHDPQTHEPASRVAWQTVTGALRRGVILLPCGMHGEVIQLTPPAVMTDAQQDCVVAALRAALDEAIA